MQIQKFQKIQKMRVLSVAVVMAFAMMSVVARAAEPAMPPECTTIASECKAAGFEINGHKNGKGLWVDCISAVSQGKTVAGVTQTKAQARACRSAARKIREAKKSEKIGNSEKN